MRKLGDNVYGFDNDTLESVVGKLLVKRRMTLSIAESCTGGLIANRITNISGSSKYFKLGMVVYSNSSKTSELGISPEKIKKYGVVSREVAVAMAEGMLKKSKTNLSLAITGIAGPTGGTREKPVGLVYIALALKNKTECVKRYFLGTRQEIKLQISTAALDLVRKGLLR